MDVTLHRLKNRQTKEVRATNGHVLRLLQVFVAHPGETLPAYFLIQSVWQNKPVGINSLRVAIRALRMALDDDQKPQTVILTVPGKGYQLNPDYLEIMAAPVSVPAERVPPDVPLTSPPHVTELPATSVVSPGNGVVPETPSRWIFARLVLVPLALTALYFLTRG
ncbi:transcriptional regulator [Salmonella enterica]